MAVRLKVGTFELKDGNAVEDFDLVAVGDVTTIAETVGTAGCILREGFFLQR